MAAYRLGNLKSMNPVMRVIYGVLGLGVLGVMATLGVMFFVVFAAIALIGGSILAARIWWVSRRLGKDFGQQFEQFQQDISSKTDDSTVIDGEYTVVDREP